MSRYTVNSKASDSKLTREALLVATRLMVEARRRSQMSGEYQMMAQVAARLKAEITEYWPDDKEDHLAYLS